MILNPTPICRFFMTVVNENANRANRRELPLSHQECTVKWEALNKPTVSFGKPPQGGNQGGQQLVQGITIQGLTNALTSAMGIRSNRGGRQGSGNRNNNDDNRQNHNKRKRYTWCVAFNSPQGCTNSQSGDGCVAADGSQFRHGCNVRVKPGNQFCSKGHTASNHK